MISINKRMSEQTRPVWDGSIADAANSEQFTNISITLGVALTIPAGCTGMTVTLHDPSLGSALFIYMVGGVLGVATANNAGILLTDADADFINDGVIIGDRVRNVSDGSIGIVTGTAATALNMAAGLSGGGTDTWRVGDVYRVETLNGPRVVIDGGASNEKFQYFTLSPNFLNAPGKGIYLLAEVATMDADILYHFD